MPEKELDVSKQIGDQSKAEYSDEKGIPFFPNHLLKEIIAIFITLAILFTLAIFLPFKLHGKANPLITPEGIKPEWYFLWVYQALKYFPPKILFITGKAFGVLLIFIALVFLQFIWPILDNAPERHPRRRRLSIIIVGGFFGFAIILTALGIVSEKTVTIGGERYHFDLKGIPHKVTKEKAVQEVTGGLRSKSSLLPFSNETDRVGGEEVERQITLQKDSPGAGKERERQIPPDASSADGKKGEQP
jgi:hypothetical protein